MNNTELLEYKSWDSEFFNQVIYNLEYTHFNELSDEIFGGLKNVLIQTKIPAYRLDALDVFQRLGFTLVESEIEFNCNLLITRENDNNLCNIHVASIDDIAKIQELSASTFTYSRFRSPWFKSNDASRLYSEWSKKAILQQYDDICLKIEDQHNGTIYGIVTAKRLNQNDACIGLICMAKEFQGKNMGTALLQAIEHWSLTQGIKQLYVSTQGSNMRACSFYLRNKYQFNTISYWLYKKVL